MTTDSDHLPEVVNLPPRPAAADVKGQRGVRAARTREADHAPGRDYTAWITALAPRVFTGTSLWTADAPSLSRIWATHVRDARYFTWWGFRAARYCWGAIHISFASVAYFAAWVTHSFPLLVSALAVAAAWHWLF